MAKYLHGFMGATMVASLGLAAGLVTYALLPVDNRGETLVWWVIAPVAVYALVELRIRARRS